jgi:hypothetical protein
MGGGGDRACGRIEGNQANTGRRREIGLPAGTGDGKAGIARGLGNGAAAIAQAEDQKMRGRGHGRAQKSRSA